MTLETKIQTDQTRRYAIAGALFGLLFPVIATTFRIVTLDLPFNVSNILSVQTTDPLLWIIDTAPFFLGIFAAIAGRRQDYLQTANSELQQRRRDLEAIQATLEQRVLDRTTTIEQRAAQFQFIAYTARIIGASQELPPLLAEITRLIGEQFNFYYTGIYLVTESKNDLDLQASHLAGIGNTASLQHRLFVDANSIVGHAALTGEPRLSPDIRADTMYQKNPNLPDSRSELGIPLRVRDKVIGVLDIHSTTKSGFSSQDTNFLSILADQIAVAIDNARLYNDAKTALAEAHVAADRYVRQEWRNFSRQSRQKGFLFDGRQISPISGQALPAQTKKLAQTGSLSLDAFTSNITVPIKLRGQTIGFLEVRPKKGLRQWTDDEFALLEAAAERAAVALENARLVETAQRRASRERAIGEISNKIGAISDRNTILQTAVEELGRKIGNTEIIIELENQA